MAEFHESVKNCTHSCITAETNYRQDILGDLFAKYYRVLYLNCDTIFEGDIPELLDLPLGGKSIAAAEMVDARKCIRSKRALFC